MLTFGGQREAVIAPGAPAVSDAVDLPVAALERLAASVYLPQRTPLATFHWGAQQTAVVTPGDTTGIAAAPGADDAAGAYGPDTAHAAASRASHAAPPLESLPGRVLVSAVLVESDQPARTVVAMGDSITDGNGSTPDRDRRWPDYLAARLAPGGVAVVNAGISGARLLGDRMGANAAARFEQDVLAQPGVATVAVLLGINDIGWPGSAFAPDEAPMTAQRMIAAYRQLIAQARVHGVRIVGGTMTPFEHGLQGTPFATHYSAAKDALRKEVNAWIRGSGEFDAVADFDAALRDPAHPARMLPRYDSGDHLHPGDAGYATMAEILNDALLFGPRPH
jgi:lysophospholipase L1-like esterase